MGSFSFMKADKLTTICNIVQGESFKFLIPKEFGGGFIKEKYQDYGNLGYKENGEPKYDMYELVAFWNPNVEYNGATVRDFLSYDGDYPKMKSIDKHTYENRKIGIEITKDVWHIRQLKHPLKLVSASYKGEYEECDGFSESDPNQGFKPDRRYPRWMSREEFDNRSASLEMRYKILNDKYLGKNGVIDEETLNYDIRDFLVEKSISNKRINNTDRTTIYFSSLCYMYIKDINPDFDKPFEEELCYTPSYIIATVRNWLEEYGRGWKSINTQKDQ